MAAPIPELAHPPFDQWSVCAALIAHAPLPMAAVEGAHHIVRQANPAYCSLMEKSMEELVGRPFAETMPEQSECRALLDHVYRWGKSLSHTEREPLQLRPVFWSYTMWPLMAEERTVGVMLQVTETAKFHEKTVAMNEALVIGSLHQHEIAEAAEFANAQLQDEICERKEAEEALRRAQAQLADRAGHLESLVAERNAELTTTNGQLEAFVYSIAHDLRAPLRSMQGFSAMLVEEAATALSERARDFARRIDKSAQFMDALLGDLLAFSRISQQHVELAVVHLGPVVASVVSRLQADIQEKHASVESSGPWPDVMAHEPTLAQLLFNLTSNALKFVRPGVPPRVRVRAEVHAGIVRVWVEDNGPGIAASHQAQIFRLFTRLGGEKLPGTGIGLAIVEKGASRMGGRAGVESTLGEGSRFWIELHAPPALSS